MSEASRKAVMNGSSTITNNSSIPKAIRPMSKRDLVVAQTKVKRTGQDAADYEQQQSSRSGGGGGGVDPNHFLQQLAAVSQLLGNPKNNASTTPEGNADNDNDDDVIPQLF